MRPLVLSLGRHRLLPTRGSPVQAPDLYLGYGASKDSPPLYSFEYPSDWEEQVVTKTDKSTMVSAQGWQCGWACHTLAHIRHDCL